jgi:hypothetical protein
LTSGARAQSRFFFQLEEGEIDVRLTSFKGCAVQQIRNREMEQRRKEQL